MIGVFNPRFRGIEVVKSGVCVTLKRVKNDPIIE